MLLTLNSQSILQPTALLQLPLRISQPPLDTLLDQLATSMTKTVQIGSDHFDPLIPIESRLTEFLYLLRNLAESPELSLSISTRSPLLMFAVPYLRAFRALPRVIIPLESHSDSIARRYLPHLPRPSERIQLARTLSGLGFPVALQLSLVPERRYKREELRLFARTVSPLANIFVVTSHNFLEGTLPNASTDSQFLESKIRNFPPDAGELLCLELAKHTSKPVYYHREKHHGGEQFTDSELESLVA